MNNVLLDAFATSTACIIANLVTHPLDTLKGTLNQRNHCLQFSETAIVWKEPIFYYI
jgi:hypothetical protein